MTRKNKRTKYGINDGGFDGSIAQEFSLPPSADDPQYSDYLYEKLSDLPLLNLWDISLILGRFIAFDADMPEVIESLIIDIDKYCDAKESGSMATALIKPFHDWSLEQLLKSIDGGEIQPEIVGRSMDGKINPKRTYVKEDSINEWLLKRGINPLFYDDEELAISYSIAWSRIHDAIIAEKKLLTENLVSSDISIPEKTESSPLIDENARLREQIHQLLNQVQINKEARKAKIIKNHGNAERFAQAREQVLGAALAVIVQWPEKCKSNSSGKFEATKIAGLIDEKSLLFWEETGEPPLSLEKMERLISKWINGGHQ
ncbi:MAG: hypothetical protein ABSB19_13595 [Methylomonas sp.]|jgi:hypothetical protein